MRRSGAGITASLSQTQRATVERLKGPMCVDRVLAQLHERALESVDGHLKALKQSSLRSLVKVCHAGEGVRPSKDCWCCASGSV